MSELDRFLHFPRYQSRSNRALEVQLTLLCNPLGFCAVAVSLNGARKILESFPCHDVGELKCSPAFDWHLSSLVERGLVNAYGMLPEAVWMPKQGELLGIEPVGTNDASGTESRLCAIMLPAPLCLFCCAGRSAIQCLLRCGQVQIASHTLPIYLHSLSRFPRAGTLDSGQNIKCVLRASSRRYIRK